MERIPHGFALWRLVGGGAGSYWLTNLSRKTLEKLLSRSNRLEINQRLPQKNNKTTVYPQAMCCPRKLLFESFEIIQYFHVLSLQRSLNFLCLMNYSITNNANHILGAKFAKTSVKKIGNFTRFLFL